MTKDYCTGFPEKWPQWVKPWKWRIADLSECCKSHDNEEDPRGGCASHDFAECLLERKIVGGGLIFLIASVACWIKYPKSQIKKV